jgi:hypothetical protein
MPIPLRNLQPPLRSLSHKKWMLTQLITLEKIFAVLFLMALRPPKQKENGSPETTATGRGALLSRLKRWRMTASGQFGRGGRFTKSL